jgi:hypothetical protein
MKKLSLPLSEAFTIHAIALMNKVHQRPPRIHKDDQRDRLLLARKGHPAEKPVEESQETVWRLF